MRPAKSLFPSRSHSSTTNLISPDRGCVGGSDTDSDCNASNSSYASPSSVCCLYILANSPSLTNSSSSSAWRDGNSSCCGEGCCTGLCWLCVGFVLVFLSFFHGSLAAPCMFSIAARLGTADCARHYVCRLTAAVLPMVLLATQAPLPRLTAPQAQL